MQLDLVIARIEQLDDEDGAWAIQDRSASVPAGTEPFSRSTRRARTIKAYAVTGRHRTPAVPDVLTVDEAGLPARRRGRTSAKCMKSEMGLVMNIVLG